MSTKPPAWSGDGPILRTGPLGFVVLPKCQDPDFCTLQPLPIVSHSSVEFPSAQNERLSAFCSCKILQHRRHQRLQICQRVARRNQHYDRDIERRQILLVLQFPIDCQEDVEVPLSKAQ